MEQPIPNSLPVALRDKSVAVIGAGRVGSAVARLLHEAGLRIAAVTSRHVVSLADLARATGAEATTDNAAAAATADIVLVTVNDDGIARVVADIAERGGFRAGQLVVHMSGALSLTVLSPAAEAGAMVGCAHPLQSFATAEDAVRLIRGSAFGVTAGRGAREQLEALVGLLGGHAVTVSDDCKTTYHAAAVMASNYLVAVEDMAVQLLVDAGFDEDSALQALRPLVTGTVSNIGALGTTRALTGPIVRGDVETVRKHIEALRPLPGGELGLYLALGRHTLRIAQRRADLGADTIMQLTNLLAERT